MMLFVWHPEIFHKYCLQFLLRVKITRRETENNAYAKFWGDKQRALWYVMVFSGVVNSLMNATSVFQLFYYPMWIHPLSVICTVKFLFYV